MKTELKTAIILGIVIVGLVGGLSYGFTSLESNSSEIHNQNNLNTLNIDKSRFKKAPELVWIEYYINTTPEELKKEIDGKVVLYDIWTYSCINCIRTLPYITAWDEKYADEGLLVIGIHSPEFEFEKNIENVKMAVNKYGIRYPVVLDNEMKTWKAFENRYWPRKYLADHEGYIRYEHIGEGAYDETEQMIQQLLNERALNLGINVASVESLVGLKEFEHSNFRTPELYFGYNFAVGRNQLGNSEGFIPEKEVQYTAPDDLQQHYFYLDGTWKNLKGSMKLVSDRGSIKLPYHAKEVNIVAANNANLEIYLDGVPIDFIYAGDDVKEHMLKVSAPRLYNIAKSETASSHLLEIVVTNPGFEIYTFTFG
jgi:thiol-disulfide isomerase/thioredoxin